MITSVTPAADDGLNHVVRFDSQEASEQDVIQMDVGLHLGEHHEAERE